MPIYDYKCERCGKNFAITMHIDEHDRTEVFCPDCRSEHVAQQYSVFFAKTSRKS